MRTNRATTNTTTNTGSKTNSVIITHLSLL